MGCCCIVVFEEQELVAEASGDGDLMTALGAAAAENGCTGLRSHANEEAMDLGAATAVGLEGALGHRGVPVFKEIVC
jgi:hypothetical protein